MTRQLVLDLPLREALGREDFFVSPSNSMALAVLDNWQNWPGGRLVLTGQAGCGKTHLVHVWAQASGARVVAATDLAEHTLPELAQTPLAVEDAHMLAGDHARESLLFHLHNLMSETRQPLLITAVIPPRDWGLVLPDLASRLQAIQTARIEQPDDMLLTAVLLKQFQDRQLAVSPAVITWLTREMDRSLSHARTLVAAIDARALALRAPVTKVMAAEVLRGLVHADDGDS